MARIEIPLTKGQNWISFPEKSADNLDTIFRHSGIERNIAGMFEYDSISSNFLSVNLLSNFGEGIGYHIIANESSTIIYDGTPFETKMTFDTLRLLLMRGWNLIGTDDNIINLNDRYNWCRVTDPVTNFGVTQLVPKKAYWIYYDDCQPPKVGLDTLTKVTIIGVAITAYVVFGDQFKRWLKREKREDRDLYDFGENKEKEKEIEKERKRKLELIN